MPGVMVQLPSVVLVSVTPENRAAVEALGVGEDQQRFVANNAESLAEADGDPGAEPRAIMSGERLVGFLMYDASDVLDVRIYRFMIARDFQGQGLGKAALRAALAEIAARGIVGRISIVYEPDNEAARRLYRSAGFMEEGLDEDDEMVAALDIDLKVRR